MRVLTVAVLLGAWLPCARISAQARPEILPPATPVPPPELNAQQVPPPAIDAKTAKYHAAHLYDYGYVLAPAWVLMDADSGQVLDGKNIHQKMFPASTTKTMTALVAIAEGNLDQMVRIGKNPPQVGEQSAYLMEGEKFSLRDLVRAAMVKSANDACLAIAEGVSGNERDFVKLMNAKAKEVGAKNTHFMNPHGLHHPQHYTTAYDLALIAREAMRYPFFNQISKTRETKIHGNWKMGGPRLLMNKNRLLFRWANCDGVKTGYTKQAGNCLISSATETITDSDGKKRPFRLIGVVMKSPASFTDSWFILQKLGFEKFRPQVVAAKNEVAGEASISGGASKAKAVFAQDFEFPVKLSTQGEPEIARRVSFVPDLKAPLQRGTKIGSVAFEQKGKELRRVPIFAAADVAANPVAVAMPAAAQLTTPNSLTKITIATLLAISLFLFFAAWRQHRAPR